MALTQKPSRTSGSRTRSETVNWETLVAEAEGPEYPDFIHPAYPFSKRVFFEDDNAGNYNKPFPPENP